jgi:thioredoxin 1
MEMQGKAIIKPVDVWKNGDTAKDFPMQAIPCSVVHQR